MSVAQRVVPSRGTLPCGSVCGLYRCDQSSRRCRCLQRVFMSTKHCRLHVVRRYREHEPPQLGRWQYKLVRSLGGTLHCTSLVLEIAQLRGYATLTALEAPVSWSVWYAEYKPTPNNDETQQFAFGRPHWSGRRASAFEGGGVPRFEAVSSSWWMSCSVLKLDIGDTLRSEGQTD